MDDDSSSVQSQETDKLLPDTPTSLAKNSRHSKESTPTPSETSSTSAVLQKSASDVAVVEKKKLDKEDSNESDVSNESDRKVIRKEGKGKAPPPPAVVAAAAAAATTTTSIVTPPTPPVTPPQTETLPLTLDIEAATKEAEIKPKKDQAPTPPAPVLPVAPVVAATTFILPVDDDYGKKSKSEFDDTKVNVVVSTSATTTTQDTLTHAESNSNIIPIPPPLAFASSTPNKSITSTNNTTITINSSTPPTTTITTDNSNSLNQIQTSVNQVTVVTSHPPVIIDNSAVLIKDPSNEVIIVSNETNKTHINESSTDDDYPSLDSLESPKTTPAGAIKSDKKSSKEVKGRKLDESEVLIVSSFVEDIEEVNEDDNNEVDSKFDTSHVSVVTVGDESIQVRDSSNIKNLETITSDLTQIPETPEDEYVANGEVLMKSSPKDDVSLIVNKKRQNKQRISPDSSVGSMDSRAQSESGSIRSAGVVVNKIDRSDAESIATTTSHDSREPDDDVIVRRKIVEEQIRNKEEMHLRNLRKKTRKRTRKFEIDGVQVTTTTSKVIYGDEENGKMYDDHFLRKQELRELKLLQKQEKKQFDELQLKEQATRDQQEKRFEQVRRFLFNDFISDIL